MYNTVWMAAPAIDINVDAGESFGAWRMGNDEEIFSLVSSVNLACGFHAGDPSTMRVAVEAAGLAGNAIGAHPGLGDLIGFGRRAIALAPDEAYSDVLYQLGALAAFVAAAGRSLSHAKMHGALSGSVSQDPDIAEAIVAAVHDFDPELPLIVIQGTELHRSAERAHQPVVLEGFPDRAYLPDGLLVPRGRPGAVIHDPEVAARRALQMVLEGTVDDIAGSSVTVAPRTLCIHGDAPQALAIARTVRAALEHAGVTVRAF